MGGQRRPPRMASKQKDKGPRPILNGLAVFERLRRKPTGEHVFLYAFDLLELDGQDLRREPLETRKATLASLLCVGAFRDCV